MRKNRDSTIYSIPSFIPPYHAFTMASPRILTGYDGAEAVLDGGEEVEAVAFEFGGGELSRHSLVPLQESSTGSLPVPLYQAPSENRATA